MVSVHHRKVYVPMVDQLPPEICHDMDVTATEALKPAEDRPFWWTVATA